MPTPIDNLRKELHKHFTQHWALNDRGHQHTHFEDVFQCARHINKVLDLGHSEPDMMFAAYFHDLFAWTRVNHHELAYQFFLTSDHPLILEYYAHFPGQRVMVALACREHRASYTGEFSSEFSALINSADRGFPGTAERLLNRVFSHQHDIHPELSDAEVMDISKTFLKKKAGSDGYARYPDLYMRVFAETLKIQQSEIDQL